MAIPDNLPAAARDRRDRLQFDWAFGVSGKPFAEWRDETRAKVGRVLEIDDLPPPEARVLNERVVDGAHQRLLTLTLADGEEAEAYLLLPAGEGPFPAVLLLHDHASEFRIGKEKLIEPWGDAAVLELHREWIARFYGGRALGSELVRRGYAVLCVDALGWGSRSGNGYEAQQALAANLMQTGTSLAAVVAREDVQAARYLMSLPQVDSRRIATLGFSFGGYRAWQTAALEPDIAAIVCASWMGSLPHLLQPGNNMLRGQSAFYMLHPELAGKLDFPDLASLIAPRPALFIAGRDDRHFPVASVEAAAAKMHAAWGAVGADEALSVLWHDGAHAFGLAEQDATLGWLDARLTR